MMVLRHCHGTKIFWGKCLGGLFVEQIFWGELNKQLENKLVLGKKLYCGNVWKQNMKNTVIMTRFVSGMIWGNMYVWETCFWETGSWNKWGMVSNSKCPTNMCTTYLVSKNTFVPEKKTPQKVCSIIHIPMFSSKQDISRQIVF